MYEKTGWLEDKKWEWETNSVTNPIIILIFKINIKICVSLTFCTIFRLLYIFLNKNSSKIKNNINREIDNR